MRYSSVSVERFVGLLLPLGVFAEDVDFDVEGAAGGEGAEAGGGVGVGDDGYLYLVADDGGYGEADAFDGDGALGNDVTGEGFGELDAEAPVGVWRVVGVMGSGRGGLRCRRRGPGRRGLRGASRRGWGVRG